jgi:septum formation protein
MDSPLTASPAASSQGKRSAVLVLASASPRREALLKQAAIPVGRIVTPEIDEATKKAELPRDYALRMARAKVKAVAATEPNAFVLGADTVVAVGRRILPKTLVPDEVERCLRLLSGRRHQVLTAIALAAPGAGVKARVVTTRVAFKALTAREISSYAASGEGIGKAGGYAIQGRAEAFVRLINGSYSNVVGLPLYETLALLEGSGFNVLGCE